jgi:plasmid stabilization system protein ParE
MATMTKDDFERKPTTITARCFEKLDKATKYLRDNYAESQAEIMNAQFFKTVKSIGRMPGIEKKKKKGMRRIMLGKFRYFIYYREKEDEIEIVGIWHTSRGTEFSED